MTRPSSFVVCSWACTVHTICIHTHPYNNNNNNICWRWCICHMCLQYDLFSRIRFFFLYFWLVFRFLFKTCLIIHHTQTHNSTHSILTFLTAARGWKGQWKVAAIKSKADSVSHAKRHNIHISNKCECQMLEKSAINRQLRKRKFFKNKRLRTQTWHGRQ